MDPTCPVARFAQVPKELRWQLRHAADSEELLTIQNAVIDYLCTVREPDFAVRDLPGAVAVAACGFYGRLWTF